MTSSDSTITAMVPPGGVGDGLDPDAGRRRRAWAPFVGGQKSLSGTPLGSPATIRKMLDFCARHGIAPQIEVMKMSEIDAAFDRLREGKPRYRIVLENDFR